MKKAREKRFRFRLVGGTWQPRIDNADDLRNLLSLDEAFWAMTVVPSDILRFDGTFLEYLDDNPEGEIHCDEVKKALRFLMANLRDLSGVMNGADFLRLADLNADAPDGPAMREAGRMILSGLGKSGAGEISLADLLTPQGENFRARAGKTQGLVAEEDVPAEFSEIFQMLRNSGRTLVRPDGKNALSLSALDDFLLCAGKRAEHHQRLAHSPGLLFDGENTEKTFALYGEVAEAVDNCFLNAAAKKFFASDPERTAKKECMADLLEPAGVRQALERSAALEADPEGMLDFSAPMNPLFQEKLRAFAALPFVAGFLEKSRLSEENWRRLKAAVSPYEQWRRQIPAGDGLEELPPEAVFASLEDGKMEKFRLFLLENIQYDKAAQGAEKLFRLLVLQRDFLRFLRNFVTLEDLFNPASPSRLQLGVLVMDGRHFTLTVPVKNIAEHKKIVQQSNICVLYVEISIPGETGSVKKVLAVGVTDGTMKHLFIGKQGVFFDADGVCLSARVVDMVKQPVSIGEALIAPFSRMADFFIRQTEKIFNTRSEEQQKNISASLNQVVAPLPKTPVATAQAPSAGLPMLLMGGGIGLAAISSSVAFIAKSLRNISFTSVLTVLAVFFLIFGAPVILLALIKLFSRDLTVFLESSGCSLNRSMRLSFRMGTIFTFAPRRPIASMLWKDPSDAFAAFRRREGSSRSGWIWVLLFCLFFALLGGFFAVRQKRDLFRRSLSASPSCRASAPAEKTKAEAGDFCAQSLSTNTGEK